jgi:hypothetical protein
MAQGRNDAQGRWTVERTATLAEWRALGNDARSLLTDPGYREADGVGAALAGAPAGAPALAIRPPDIARAGRAGLTCRLLADSAAAT